MLEDILKDYGDALMPYIKDGTIPLVLFLSLVFFVVINKFLNSFGKSKRRRTSGTPWERGYSGSGPVRGSNYAQGNSGYTDMSDPKNQLEAISKTNFERVPLLNASEAPLLHLLESVVDEADGGFRVMAQTSLGEIIRPRSENKKKWALANASINSKRLDFAIFNRFNLLVAAIEYQGSGHYHQNSFMRDAVKREALRRAGVPFIEVQEDFSADQVRQEIASVLQDAAGR